MGESRFDFVKEGCVKSERISVKPWPVPSRPLVSLPEVKLRVSSWPPRPSVNRHSSVLFVRLLKISKLIFGSSPLPLELFRKHLRLTWSVFLKIPTCALSTPRGSPLCQRISSLQEESVVNVLKNPNPFIYKCSLIAT